MTEIACDEKSVVSTEATCAKERIAERKTIVYETRVDPTVIKVAGQKLKEKLFTRFIFFKPRPEWIEFVSMDLYYEPYMMIRGKYSVDYYRKRVYTVKVDRQVREVILLNHQFKPEKPMDSDAKGHAVIKLEGEEQLKKEAAASLVLDKCGCDVTVQELPVAPSVSNPGDILAEFGAEKIAGDADLDTIRSKIVKRPSDISRLVSELFEVTERVVIYTPRFRVVYRNLETGEERSLEFDGITAERIKNSKHIHPRGTILNPPPPPPPP